MKLGRKPRAHDERIPKMSALLKDTITLPAAIDYSNGMPADLGAMLNEQLGDCTAAAVGHAIQVFSFNAHGGKMVSPTDAEILKLYEGACGYIPGDPSTDDGGVEQTVLAYWENNPVAENELTAYIEINPTKLDDVKRAIYESGLVYLGLDVPSYVMDHFEAPGSTWDVSNTDTSIAGGHAVIATGYDEYGNLTVISWGSRYTMTPAFWLKYVDEAYALANVAFIEATGKSPAGLSIAELEALMEPLKYQPPGERRNHRRKKKHRGEV